MNELILKIKRADTPFFAWLKGFLKTIMRCNFIPSIKPIHLFLYQAHVIVRDILHRAYNGLWCVPAFQAKCYRHGKNLSLPCGMPLVLGPIRIEIGDDVAILDSTLASGHVYNNPRLRIGSRVTIGYHTDISVAQEVSIGDDVMFAKDCFVADNDGHPLSPERRLNHDSVNASEVKPVKIGNNVWIGTGSYILKGSNIGDGAVIAANSVVTGEVRPNSLYAGSPAKFVRYIGDPGSGKSEFLNDDIRIHT